ncbi:glycosyltransferase family 4 protein [Paenibacillus senegalensis]|uniref:glycosyltransferase family 4 protein n=1 Tax=Paenibacillus senegalensis TaxID=1465766 RepID=UPI00028979DF|nr:glycosyltransferase family 4 protein [Paenibacillus senegalensis]
MSKVLILANNDVGLYKFRKELIQKLTKEYEVYISLPHGEFVPQLIDLGCKFIDTSINRRGTNPITDIKLLLSYNKIMREVNPSVVLTYTIKPNVYGGLICRIGGIPYIVNITGLGSAVENGGLLQKITLLLYKLSLKRASCIFFQNEENRKFLSTKRIIKGGNQKLIPGSGVNLDDYPLLDYPSVKSINFLFVGRVMKEKGIDQYLEAAEYITSKYSNTVFHVVGFCEETYEEKLIEMQESGTIRYHGMQKSVLDFYRMSHCIVHPTYYPEGMSNVLLEGASCGRPIITTDRAGCREIVDDGVNGYVVEQENSGDLIEKIKMFLELSYEKKKQMGLAGRRKVEKEFNRDIVVKEYLNQIKKV